MANWHEHALFSHITHDAATGRYIVKIRAGRYVVDWQVFYTRAGAERWTVDRLEFLRNEQRRRKGDPS